MRLILLTLALFSILIASCERKKTSREGEIHIYLLSDHESLDPLWEIDESTIVTEVSPFIKYEDILSYDPKNHTFKISSNAQENLKGKEFDIHTRAFVLVANLENIYTGYFWASYSSAICPWLTIDPIHARYAGELRVELGYPGLMEGMSIPDRRNDERILSILRHDQKLIE
ncbi:MAG: hypothetical protein AMS23_02825 [Bacteroides sp. SM1_62]|nr:MAG: hypothetical protein AMS23_02825 [Bacteroides sp. SM1_62]